MNIEKIKIDKKWKNGDSRNGLLCVYRNGKLISETPYQDGKIHGKVKTYYEDGTIESEQWYLKGVYNGKSINYDKNGRIVFSCIFENGVLLKESGESYSYEEYEDEKYF